MIELCRDQYLISSKTLGVVLAALDGHWFSTSDGEEYNNDDIIDAQGMLEEEIKSQSVV